MQTLKATALFSALLIGLTEARTEILTPLSTTISPDASEIMFSWKGDIWKTSATGGEAHRVTTHPAEEYRPLYTPDGKSFFFNTMRKGNMQVFKKNISGGEAQQITKHTETTILEDISTDGSTLLLRCLRDSHGRNPLRLYSFDIDGPGKENLIFDTYATGGKLSPDNKKILFTREGVTTYRKQYEGTQAGQIWIFNKETGKYSQPVKSRLGVRWPFWAPNGKTFYYVSQQDGTFNLYRYNFSTTDSDQLTFFKDDGVILPSLSNDGSTIIFRRLFHMYTLSTRKGSKPTKIELFHNEIDHDEDLKKVSLTKTSDADFSPSGLEIAFNANDNLYVMDTVLREPVQITDTFAIEKNIQFGDKGKSIYYLSDNGIRTKICKVTKKDPKLFWWKSSEFEHATLYESAPTISHFSLSPDEKSIAIATTDGRLVITDNMGNDPKVISHKWNTIYYSWSPDSKWLTYSQQDNNFNSDIYIAKADASEDPINISQHPDNEYAASWSPDGKKIAFIGRRFGTSYDIFVADLYKKEHSSRSKKEEAAEKAMSRDPNYKKTPKVVKTKPSSPSTEKKSKTPTEKSFALSGITKRFKRIKMSGNISSINWTHDSKKLLVQARSGKTITAIDVASGKGAKFADANGPIMRIEKTGKLFMVNKGQPAVVAGGKATNYTFKTQAKLNKRDHFRKGFRHTWRIMGDSFYDPTMNNRDWKKILKKYEDVAAASVTGKAFGSTVSAMLGELNASHTGFQSKDWSPAYKPSPQLEKVAHIGVKFDKNHQGVGYKVSYVFPDGPATREYSKLEVGDIITSIAGKIVDAQTPITESLLQPINKEIALTVKNKEGKEKKIKIQPISFTEARRLSLEAAIKSNEDHVSKISKNTLGYIHIQKMLWSQFEQFERHIYEKGYGKEGLIIDVRDNGGGFTTDHLLTVLNQKLHAFTIPRNGGTGYPQDRIVYATWNKPIIVLCNQNSFSNAEIFSHAIKTLKRGKLVGVQTAGGVISTGSKSIPNIGSIRLPFRGWFDLQGTDMEMNGAMPDITIWPTPGDMATGIDKQLDLAIEVILQDVKAAKPLHKKAIYKSGR